MNKDLIKNNFDVDDIHRIRESNYERQKNMTAKEAMADNEKRSNEAIKRLREKGIIIKVND